MGDAAPDKEQGLPEEDGISSSSAHHFPHPPSADDKDADIRSPDDQRAAEGQDKELAAEVEEDEGREDSLLVPSQSHGEGSSGGQQGGEPGDWDVSESLKQLAQLQQNVEDTFGIKSPVASFDHGDDEQKKEDVAEGASRRSELSRGMTLKALAAMAPPGSPFGGVGSLSSLGGGINTTEEERLHDDVPPDSPVLASVRGNSLHGRMANSNESSSKRPPTGKPLSMSFDMALTPSALERHASGDAPGVMQRNTSDPINRLHSSASSAVYGTRSRRGSEQFDEIRANKTVPRLRWPGSTTPYAPPVSASGGNTPLGVTPRLAQHGGASPMLAAVHHGNASPMVGSKSPRAR